jgi:hypothetical protein
MAQPICKVFLARATEAWYQLSEDEQRLLLGKVNGALEQSGGKPIITCSSGWATEQWSFWGVEEYPDFAALQKHDELLNALNWFRYVESTTTLGVRFQPA